MLYPDGAGSREAGLKEVEKKVVVRRQRGGVGKEVVLVLRR